MFHDSHELYYIVPELFDPRQDIDGEFRIGTDPILGRRYANYSKSRTSESYTMSFVDSDRLRTGRRVVLKNVFLGRIPEHGIIDRRIRQVLCHPFNPNRKSVNMPPLQCGHRDLSI